MSVKSNYVAIQVADHIRTFVGKRAIIAGGCARDVHFGIEPKDYDIILPRLAHYDNIRAALDALDVSYREMNFYRYNEGSESDRVAYCFKFTYQGIDFDLLVYLIDEATEAPAHFDFNLNQFILDAEGQAEFVGEFHPDEGLVAIRGDHSPKREAYVKAKYQQLYATH